MSLNDKIEKAISIRDNEQFLMVIRELKKYSLNQSVVSDVKLAINDTKNSVFANHKHSVY